MQNNRKRFLSYKTVVISNLLLVTLPIIIMISLFISESSSQIRGEILEMRRVNLEKTQQSIDTSMRNFSSMVLYASLDNDLKPYPLRQNNYDAITALHHLKQHASVLNDMEIYFHITSDDCFYSVSGRMDFSTFERIYSFEGWDSEDFFDFITATNAYTLSPTGCRLTKIAKAERYIAVLYPWQYGSNVYGTVIALIREDWLAEQLRGEYDGTVYMLNAEGQPIVGSALEDGIVPNETANAVIGGESAELIWIRSELTGWTYMTYVPKTRITAMLYGDHLWIFLAVLALALCFSTLGVCLAVRYYRPVRDLKEVLADEDVHDKVRTILETNEDMKNALEDTREYLIQDFLLQMFRGHLSEGECLSRAQKLNLPLNGGCFAAIVLCPNTEITAQSRSDALDRLLRSGICAADISDTQSRNLIALYRGESGSGHFADDLIDAIRRELSDIPALRVKIGVGQVCAAPCDLNRSYIEALAALRGESGEAVRYFGDLTEPRFKLIDTELVSRQIRLTEMIRQGNTADVEQALDELEGFVVEIARQTDVGNLRFMLDAMLHELMPVFDEAEIANLDWKLNLAVHTVRPDQFVAALKPLCLQAARLFAGRRDTQQNEQCARILEYIDSHYLEHTLTQAMVAEKFDLTPTTFSRLFSECVGLRFIDYVSQKRMTRAAELLSSSEWGIREIVNMVGYIDVSSFTRKFTAAYGMSPTAYRNRFSVNGEENKG